LNDSSTEIAEGHGDRGGEAVECRFAKPNKSE
jgi:hypothetical protein